MRRSKYRRESKYSKWFSGRRRIIAAVATLVAFGGIVTVTQVSDASTRKGTQKALAACDDVQAPKAPKLSKSTKTGTWTTNHGKVTQHADDGSEVPTQAQMRKRCRDWVMQNAGNTNTAGNTAGTKATGGAGTAAPTVNCPDVKVNVAIPQQAQAEVKQNLALLATQIDEANKRIVSSAGQGGANFIQNAILGPLADKRLATIKRIETAIGRNAAKPDLNAAGLSKCTLNENSGGANGGGANNGGANNGGANNGGNNGGTAATPPPGAGLGVLENSCKDTKLPLHDGFQKGNTCVTTEFGEVGSEANNPTLLIVDAPTQVNVNQAFSLKVSTRNLIRDRFLGAAAGGYYVESSILKDGLVRGHFHTACRVLANTNEAPPSDPVPDFFVATEDSKGGATPDVVTINVPGIKKAGTVQCASWAGDGSHRIPMMQRANQTPAFDTARIIVRAGGGGGNNNGGNNNGGNNNGQAAGGN